jgi:hypothetical protein
MLVRNKDKLWICECQFSVYRVYSNSTDKLLGLVGGFKVYSEKLVRVVCAASSPRYRPMKYCCACRVCNHLCASVAACSCVFRTAVDGSTWLVWPPNTALLDASVCTPNNYSELSASPQHRDIGRWMYRWEVLPERGVGYAQSVCPIVNNMGWQITLSSMVEMRFQNVIEEPLRN